MKNKGMQLGAMLAAMLLLSMAFVPAVSAQEEKISEQELKKQVQGINKEVQDALKGLENAKSGEVTIDGWLGDLGATICEGLVAALWMLERFVTSSRIDQAISLLETAADNFTASNINLGMTQLNDAIGMIWGILSDFISQIPSWLYNEIVELLNAAQDFINQYS